MATRRTCPRCHGPKGPRAAMCWRCRYGTPRRVPTQEPEPSGHFIRAPVNPIVVPPWVECPDLEFGFDVVGVFGC
jgi:hypothetical protein